jgi:membrane-bound lytic murein transglycosylase D
LQRFVDSASTVAFHRSRLLIASAALMFAAGCSTMVPGAGNSSSAAASSTVDSDAAPIAASDAAAAQGTASTLPATIGETGPPVPPAFDSNAPQWTGRDETVADGDLWDRIRAGFAMPELETTLVADKERFYLSKPDYLERMFTRGGRYLFHIVEEIEKRGMPTELALLPFVESAMNPVALSTANAAGLWQFIPSTGKAFNLEQNWWVDNRRDVVKSTEAALDYLQKIYEMHGNDWFLALASYNWGEGAVGRAIKRNQAAGRPTDYLSLRMPNETRHYVPKLIALKHIIQRAGELGVALPELPNRPYFVTIEKTRPIDLKLAARFAGMSVDEFVALNPAHNRPVISASRNNEIKLPADRVDAFVDAVERHGQSNLAFATWQPYTMKSGDTLETLASRAGIPVAELRAANGLRSNGRILAGTQILSPHRDVEDETRVERFDGPRVYEIVETAAVYHVVRPRDTLTKIARRYGTTVTNLRKLNSLDQAVAPRGTRLLVRPARTQTMLTTEQGARQVVAQSEARVMRAVLRQERASAGAEAASTPPAAKAPVPKAPSPTAARQPATPKSKTALTPAAKAPAQKVATPPAKAPNRVDKRT